MRYLPECEDREYWHKRFNFASWIFLLMSFYSIFVSENGFSAIFAITISLGFQFFDSWHQIRHMKWHMNRNGGDNMHL